MRIPNGEKKWNKKNPVNFLLIILLFVSIFLISQIEMNSHEHSFKFYTYILIELIKNVYKTFGIKIVFLDLYLDKVKQYVNYGSLICCNLGERKKGSRILILFMLRVCRSAGHFRYAMMIIYLEFIRLLGKIWVHSSLFRHKDSNNIFLPSNSSSKCHIFCHQSDSLCVKSTCVCIFEETHEMIFSYCL